MVVFRQMPYFLQHFAKNCVKTLVHGTLHKEMLVLTRSTTFGCLSPNAILFATFCIKLGQNPSARYFAQKVATFDNIDKFLWFFTKCHTFCNIFLNIGSKTLVHGTLHKKLLLLTRSTSFGGFSPNAILFPTFCSKLGQNLNARHFPQKLGSFDEIDKFWWFFTKCHTLSNILLKIGSKP